MQCSETALSRHAPALPLMSVLMLTSSGEK